MAYDVIYADPCWTYRNVRTGGSHTSGAAQKYPVLSVDEIAALPIASIASKSSVCFMWATTPLGGDPYRVLDTWGYEYKTEILIGIRGDVAAWRANIDNWQEFGAEIEIELIEEKSLGHSRKPATAIRLIERLTPMPYLRRAELFATFQSLEVASRADTPIHWDCYGLDFGHDFRDPAFWTAIGGRITQETTT